MTGSNIQSTRWTPLNFLVSGVVAVLVVMILAGCFFLLVHDNELPTELFFWFPVFWGSMGLGFWLTQGPEPDRRLEGRPNPETTGLRTPRAPGVTNRIFLGLWGLSWAAILGLVGFFGAFLFMFVAALVFQALYVRRLGRQEDIARVLNMATAKQADLGGAIRALAEEYDEFTLKKILVWGFSCFLLPGYVLIRQNGWRWGPRLRRLAHRLESGQSLPLALAADPTLVPCAYRVSENPEKGLLALAGLLDGAPPVNSGMLWLEVFPRMVYPMIVVVLVCQVLTFHAIYITPKMQRIFKEFGLDNQAFHEWGLLGNGWVGVYEFLSLGLIFTLFATFFMAIAGPSWRWWLPFSSFFYRPESTGSFLKRFGLLLGRGHNEVEILDALGSSYGFPLGLRNRIRFVLRDIQMGQPMLDSLSRHLCLGKANRALLGSSQRAQQLPWVMQEVGERMIRIALRRVQWASQFCMVLCVLLVGTLVGFVCLSIFYPLVQLIEALA